ncbi:fumarylacetoacetate hydrolase family protein [Photobacterium makurazakiensis]
MMKKAHVEYQGQRKTILSKDGINWVDEAGAAIDVQRVSWLPPASGSLVGLAVNTARHADEVEMELPENPVLYYKLPNTLIGHKDVIQRPEQIKWLTPQAELVVVIGKPAYRVTKADALGHVEGYTILNGVTAQDYVNKYYRPPVKAKSFDGTGPIGPWIVSADEVGNPDELVVTTRINDEVISIGSTADYKHSVADAITWISSFMTLRAGDMIAMGTPCALAELNEGDLVEIEIEKVGKLENTVVNEMMFYQLKK